MTRSNLLAGLLLCVALLMSGLILATGAKKAVEFSVVKPRKESPPPILAERLVVIHRIVERSHPEQ